MQLDAVRLFHYLENRLTAKVHSCIRKKLYGDQKLLYEQMCEFLIDGILLWSWTYAKVPVEVERTGYTPVLALTCGESSLRDTTHLRSTVAWEGDGKTKLLLTTMSQALQHQGNAMRLLTRDIENILEGL